MNYHSQGAGLNKNLLRFITIETSLYVVKLYFTMEKFILKKKNN